MKKYCMVSILTFLAVALMSGAAFAAPSLNAGNTTVAAEKISSAAAYAAAATNTAYQPGGAVAITSQIKVSLTNGSFTAASNLQLCLGATPVAGNQVVAAAPNNTSVTFTTTVPLASSDVITLSGANNACATAPVAIANVNIAAGSLAGTVVSLVFDNALTPGDPNIFVSAPVVTVQNQFSASLVTAAANTIDFAAVPTLSKFKVAPTTQSEAKVVLFSNEGINDKVVTGVTATTCGAWAGGADTLRFTLTPVAPATFSGVAAATGFQYKDSAATATTIDNAITAAKAAAVGTVVMNAGAAINLCGSSASSAAIAANAGIPTDINVNGTTALTARSYTLTVEELASAIAIKTTRTLLPATTAYVWTLDATQYYVPLIKASTGVETYIKLQSKTTLTAANGVLVQILATDGTLVTYNAPAIVTGTPLNITGSDLVAAAAAAGHPVSGTAGFAAIITINTPNADIFGFANIVNANGEKRVPLQRVYAAGAAQIVE